MPIRPLTLALGLFQFCSVRRTRASEMAKGQVTYFVVVAFQPVEGRRSLLPVEPFEAPSAETAKRHARRYADVGGAALAFVRSGDPTIGVWEPGEIICQYGAIPEDALERLTEAA